MMHDMMQELLCTTFKCTEIHKDMMHERPTLISQSKLTSTYDSNKTIQGYYEQSHPYY